MGKRRSKTKKEKQHLERVASLGCIICCRPATIHHIRSGVGMGQRSSHYDVIPLCPEHHQTGGHGVAIHAGRRTWEENFGTELELLDRVRVMLDGQE